MTDRRHHRHRRAHRRHDRRGHHCVPGFISRVAGGLAERFGLPFGVVLAGFIVGLVLNAPLTILVFFGAMYWLKYPERAERMLAGLVGWVKGLFTPSQSRRHAYAGAGSGGFAEEPEGADLDFADLRVRFEDLERRAGAMEEHVSSDEMRVNREIHRMRERD